jgi:hypothetical protein
VEREAWCGEREVKAERRATGDRPPLREASRPAAGSRRGADRFRAALRRLVLPPERGERPKPGSAWEAWAEYRLECLEDDQRWMRRIILGALVLQVGLQVLQMLR